MTIQTRSTVPFRVAAVLVTLTAASLWIDHPSGAQAVVVDRGSRDYTLPDQMQWRDTANGKTANLYGDPSKPGIYVARIKFPPHLFSRPHWHNTDRHIVVLKGTWYMGVGETFDPSTAVPMPVGSYIKHPAGASHWDGAKDEEVELQVIGIGPVTTDLVQKDAPMFGPDK